MSSCHPIYFKLRHIVTRVGSRIIWWGEGEGERGKGKGEGGKGGRGEGGREISPDCHLCIPTVGHPSLGSI